MGLDTGVGDAAVLPSFTDFFGPAPAATDPAKSDKKKKGNSDPAPAAREGQGAGKKSNTEAKQEGKKKGGIQAGGSKDAKSGGDKGGQQDAKQYAKKDKKQGDEGGKGGKVAAAEAPLSNRAKKKLKNAEKNAAAAAGEKRKNSVDGPAEAGDGGDKPSKKAKKGEDSGADEGEEQPSGLDKREKEERTVFVGGVPLSVTVKQLKRFFSDAGEVESARLRSMPIENPALPKRASVAMGKLNTELRNTCNAYVVFKEKEAAVRALRKGGAVLDKHVIRVDLASGGTEHATRLSVFVGNLPFHCEEHTLREHFAACGAVTNVRIIRDKDTALGKGFGYVTFTNGEEVGEALKHPAKFMGRELRVFRASKRAAPTASAPGKGRKASKIPPKPQAKGSEAAGAAGGKKKARWTAEQKAAQKARVEAGGKPGKAGGGAPSPGSKAGDGGAGGFKGKHGGKRGGDMKSGAVRRLLKKGISPEELRDKGLKGKSPGKGKGPGASKTGVMSFKKKAGKNKEGQVKGGKKRMREQKLKASAKKAAKKEGKMRKM